MLVRRSRDADPANLLWSRFNRVRMSVEQIRDSILALSGKLDLTMGGSLLPAGPAMEAGGSRLDLDEVETAHDVHSGASREHSSPAHDVRLRRCDHCQRRPVTHERGPTSAVHDEQPLRGGAIQEFAKRLLDDAALVRHAADRARVSDGANATAGRRMR